MSIRQLIYSNTGIIIVSNKLTKQPALSVTYYWRCHSDAYFAWVRDALYVAIPRDA